MTLAYPTSFESVHAPAALTALLIADSENAAARAKRTLADGGIEDVRSVRLMDVGGEGAPLAGAGLVWIEIESMDDATEQLLRRIDGDVDQGLCGAVVATVPELIDSVIALVSNSRTEVVIGRSELERAAALALATLPSTAKTVRESSSDDQAARLRQLSEEVSRIAATLARISGDAMPASTAASMPASLQAPATDDLPTVPAESVRAIIRARRARGKYLPADLFADPAWDMLLDLLQAELVQHRVPVSSLCIAAAVPATTALRWIKSMTDRGLLVRRPDPHDARRVFMELARQTSYAMRQYFGEVGTVLV